MKIFELHRTPRHIIACHILVYLTIQFVSEADAKLGHVGWAKSDARTKQILQNIRSRIAAQQAEEQQQQQLEKCDPKLSTCATPSSREVEDDSAEKSPTEVIPPLRFRARHKTAAQLKKDVGHAVALRDSNISGRRSTARKREKEEDVDTKSNKHEEDKIRVKEVKPVKKTAKDGGNDDDDDDGDDDKVKERKPVKKRVKDDNDDDESKEKKSKKKVERPKQKADIPHKTEKVLARKMEDKREERVLNKVESKIKEPKPTEVGKPMKAIPKPKVAVKREKKPEKKKDDRPQRFPEDIHVFSLATDSVQSEECKKHSRVYLRQLERYKMWALMMYDATAKVPSGILQGNTNQYGDFDECLSINATFKKRNREGIEGKYCLATIDISTDSRDPGLQHAIHRSQSFGFVKSKISDPGHFIPRFTTINWGLCIPSVCKAEDLENSIKSSLHGYKKSSGLTFDVKVEEKNCVTKRDLLSEYDLKTFITLLFYVGVVAVAIFASLNDKNCTSAIKKLRPSNEHKEIDSENTREGSRNDSGPRDASHGKLKAFVNAFSLKRNVKKLFIEGENEDCIDCIHGIKSIFTMMLYFAHKTIPLALTPFSNRVVLTEISNDITSMILRGSIVYTDSFLLISGVLTSFNLYKDIKRRGRILWIRRTISRFIRLTPALLATLLFYAYISNYMGSGPIWNVVVKENSVLCQKYMWRNLLYIQNFFPFEEMCAPQTHQLALDMQLFLLSPLLVYALYEYDKIGIGILQALLMMSAILRFTSIMNNELSVVIYHGMPISQLYKTANLVYTQTFHRATPYIIGIIVGFYLKKFEKQITLPKAVVVIGWITSACLALSSFIAPARLTKRDYQYDPGEAAHYAALSPIAWSVALGWFISACHLGYGGKMNRYLSCKVFTVFSRISYSVYLVQFLVFSHIVGSKRIPQMFSVMGSLDIAEFTIIILASIAMTLLFDIPTVEIKTIVLGLLPEEKKEVEETRGDGESKDSAVKEGNAELEESTVQHSEQDEIVDEDEEGVEETELTEDELEDEEMEDLDYDRLEDEYDEEIEDKGEVFSTLNVEEDIDFWRARPED